MELITPILAEASNSFMGQFIYAGIALLGGIVAGLSIMAYIKRPDPTQIEQPIRTNVEGEVNIRSIDKFATRDFVTVQHSELSRRIDTHDKEIGILREDMKEDRRNNEVHASQRSANIHSKIDNVRSELSDKIDDMPARIIDQLSKLNLLRRPEDRRS